jgi:hypothetical protein
MSDLFAYHVAKEQMAELRRTAGHTRVTSTASHRRSLMNIRGMISRALSRISKTPIDQRTASVTSQPVAPGPTHRTGRLVKADDLYPQSMWRGEERDA